MLKDFLGTRNVSRQTFAGSEKGSWCFAGKQQVRKARALARSSARHLARQRCRRAVKYQYQCRNICLLGQHSHVYGRPNGIVLTV
jgi:hypothetical protein